MELSEMATARMVMSYPASTRGPLRVDTREETTSRVAVLEKKLVSTKVISTVMATKSRGL